MNDLTHPPAKREAPTNFPAMLKVYAAEIERALPKHLSGDRMCRIALTEFRKNPKLAECDPRSVFGCVVAASQLGLEIGMQGQGWLVPYYDNKKKKLICQFIPGWQGINDLVARAGRATTWTGAVYEGDTFDYALGDRPFVTHKPSGEDESEDKLTHVYAIGRVKNAEWPVLEVWPIAKVKRHRDKYNKQGDKHYSYENLEMYGRKVVLLQVLKYMPKSAEVMQGMTLAQSAASGTQNIDDAKPIIEGTWAPSEEEDGNDTAQQQTGAGAASSSKPSLSDEDFKRSLPKWRTLIAGGKKSSDEIIAMIESKNTLTQEQKDEIEGKNDPAKPEAIVALRAIGAEHAVSDTDIAKYLGVEKLEGITVAQLEKAMAFVKDPIGAQK